MRDCLVSNNKHCKEYRNSMYENSHYPRVAMECPKKRSLRAEILILMERAWPWLPGLQRSHSGAMLAELAGNLPSGTHWKSILLGPKENWSTKKFLLEAHCAKLPKGSVG